MDRIAKAIKLLEMLPKNFFYNFGEGGEHHAYENDYLETHRGSCRIVIVAKKAGFVIKTRRHQGKEDKWSMTEKRISYAAKEQHLQNYFANYLGEFDWHGRKFYLFEKFSHVLAETTTFIPTYTRRDKEGRILLGLGIFLNSIKSENKFYQLHTFIIDNHINDLHLYNLAVSAKRKHLVIIDYGSW